MATERKRPVVPATIEEKIEHPEQTLPTEQAAKDEAETGPGDELDETDEETGPTYRREELGPRLQDHALSASAEQTQSTEQLKEALDHDDLVPLLFPTRVSLQDKGLMHHWDAGVHLVPAALSNHWWLKHNRVKKAGPVVRKSVEA